MSESSDSNPKSEKQPLVLVLHKFQTKEEVLDMLFQATRTVLEKDNVDVCRIAIRGFEGDSRHPVQIKAAKRKYAEACEVGLLGFLVSNGFEAAAREVYCMAYLKGKVRIQNNSVRFKHANEKDIAERFKSSSEAYFKFLNERTEREKNESV